MQYEVNIDEVITVVTTLLCEEIDTNVEPFGTYETAKIKMMMEKKLPKIDQKRKRMIKDLEGKFREGQIRIIEGK